MLRTLLGRSGLACLFIGEAVMIVFGVMVLLSGVQPACFSSPGRPLNSVRLVTRTLSNFPPVDICTETSPRYDSSSNFTAAAALRFTGHWRYSAMASCSQIVQCGRTDAASTLSVSVTGVQLLGELSTPSGQGVLGCLSSNCASSSRTTLLQCGTLMESVPGFRGGPLSVTAATYSSPSAFEGQTVAELSWLGGDMTQVALRDSDLPALYEAMQQDTVNNPEEVCVSEPIASLCSECRKSSSSSILEGSFCIGGSLLAMVGTLLECVCGGGGDKRKHRGGGDSGRSGSSLY